MSPGRAVEASRRSARLSGPPDTARPSRSPGWLSRSRSSAKRATRGAPGTIYDPLLSSVAARLGLGGRQQALEFGAQRGPVNLLEFGIGFAGLAGLAELHQALAEIEEAVGGALALLVAAIIGEQRLGGGAGLALVQQGPPGEIIGPTYAAVA